MVRGGSHEIEYATVPLHVVITGAGIGGLTAAIALRKQGHDVLVCFVYLCDIFKPIRNTHLHL